MKRVLFFLLLIVLISRCNDHGEFKSTPKSLKPVYLAPIKVLLDTVTAARRVDLKSVPPPPVIKVPKVRGGYYTFQTESGEAKVKLTPPVIVKAKAPEANFTNFTSDQGLVSGVIFSGIMDKKGQLWFSTGNNISRYNPNGGENSFSTFTVGQGSPVNNILEDKSGNLWFATLGGGVYRYDGINFTNFTTREGLAHNIVDLIMQDKQGTLWFGTYGGGVSRFDGKSFTTLNTINGLASNDVSSIVEDKKGNIWFGTYGSGVSCFDGTRFKTFTKKDGLTHNMVYSIMEDTIGNLWFGTLEGVSRYDGINFTTIDISVPTSKNTNAIVQDKNGNIWFGTFGGGVSRYDGTRFTIFTTDQGLANNSIHNITEDKNGNLWFGTDGGGLSRYNGKSFNAFTSKQGLLKNRVYSIVEDKNGFLWFGTFEGGISRYDGINFTTFTTSQGLAQNDVFSILQDKSGNFWLATNMGVSCYNGSGFTNFSTAQGLVNNHVSNIIQDKTGSLWFSTTGGLSRYDGKRFTNFTTDQGLANNYVNVAAEDLHGDLWFGTEGGGVSRFDGKSFTNYSVDQGLAHNIIRSIISDKSGNLWFGTTKGVSRFDGSGFISFNTTHGLADNIVNAIVEDEQGVIWFGTDQGFSGLKFNTLTLGSNSMNIKGAGLMKESNEVLKSYEPIWEIYNNKNGYPVKDLLDRAVCITKLGLPNENKKDLGLIWGGSSDEKVVRFDPKSVIKNNEKPFAFFQAVKINEMSLNWYTLRHTAGDSALIAQQEVMVYGKSLTNQVRDSLQKKFADIQFDSISPYYQLPQNLILPFRHNRVTIDFGCIETSRYFMVRYQYMLEGYDKEWSPITDKTSATFGNISEGTYTFKLKARSPEGVWSEPISYHFKVLPPWWRTWWFRVIEGIFVIVLFYGIYRWRTATLRRQKRILELTVKERTAEVVKQKEKSDELLLNILPSEVAEELKEKGYTTAKSFDEVTILFSDIKGFTHVAERMTAQELVKEINTYFSAFDAIILKHGLEKIKTIGDAYIAAGGLPEKNSATAQNVIEAAIAMQQSVEKLKQERAASNKPYFELRIGIHSGPVVAGVVGIKKFQYDIWGDTVNLAARMEQSGVPGKINISQHTYELVKEQFSFTHRGKIEAKNKGEIDMYFVDS